MTSIPDVPWLIEGGAKHTVHVARNLAFMAAGGTEGVVLGKHLEVREQAVPNDSIRVFPGTGAVMNRATGSDDEMYVCRVGSETTVDISPTDAGGGRSDLIVLRVENPWAAGETWPDPSDPTVGPYASLSVIENVPANTNYASDLGLSADHSMIALARIDIPASTATITQDMIVDLRSVANAVSQRQVEVFAPTTGEDLTSGAFVNWPSEFLMLVDIPEWATHARIKGILGGIRYGAGGNNGGAGWEVAGSLRFKLGDNTSQATAYKGESEDGKVNQTFMLAAPKLSLPEVDRGKKGVNLRIEGNKASGSTSLRATTASMIHVEIEFINDIESNV